MRISLPIVWTILAIEASSSIQEGCELSLEYRTGDLREPQPLILADTALDEQPAFLLPNAKKRLVIPKNASIVLSCPGSKNGLLNFTEPRRSARATCLKGKHFLVTNGRGLEVREFSEFRCKTGARDTVRKSQATCLDNQHQMYEIGFELRRGVFLKLLDICRDDSRYATRYVKSRLPREILGHQSSYPRPYWKYGPYYGSYDMRRIYRIESQLGSLEAQLGSAELARDYIRPGAQFLNRGHLAAKADFVYGSQQSATFWLLNTAPQWSNFNAGNWLRIEEAVKKYVAERGVGLDVYTGVHGAARLPGPTTGPVLYLHANGTTGAREFPVPRYFWKVIHDVGANRALAFVGLNEPYAANVTRDMYLCPDIGDEASDRWIGWQPRVLARGLAYLCSVEALRLAVPAVPQLGEAGVLSLVDASGY
ncbi:uncharacterized protein LOC111643477 [Copidosoma floridanum]|uniref:uncharacterized protein LOC111643477 n=1 Tax=Copidosoma floridanum TaxID=29053 RepID=UPI000C6F57A8|nr:uncharacterized protein LOC111643477 [Copidosoma floridanum]